MHTMYLISCFCCCCFYLREIIYADMNSAETSVGSWCWEKNESNMFSLSSQVQTLVILDMIMDVNTLSNLSKCL